MATNASKSTRIAPTVVWRVLSKESTHVSAEKSSQNDAKTYFTTEWHFKIIQGQAFYDAGKPIRHFITLHNNIGFNSKDSEDMANKITKNSIPGSDHPTVAWGFFRHGTPRISAKTLHRLKVDSLGYIFAADSMGLSSFTFPRWAPKDASFVQ